jgi:hypothetical protein
MRHSNRWKRLSIKDRVFVASTFLAAFSLLKPSPTQAATRAAQEREARKACLSGDYVKGVSILSDLFVDTKDTTYIFNQARCFQQNRHYEDALARFQEYLRAAPDIDASDKAAAEKHIADCQELLTKQNGHPATPPAPATPPEPSKPKQPEMPPPSPFPNATPDLGVAAEAASPRNATAGSALRTGGIVTASVGGAALIGGLIFNLKANGMAHDLGTYGGYSDSKESQRKNYETASWVGYGLGAASVAAGGVLYYLGIRVASHSSSGVAFLPVLEPDLLGATLGGTF